MCRGSRATTHSFLGHLEDHQGTLTVTLCVRTLPLPIGGVFCAPSLLFAETPVTTLLRKALTVYVSTHEQEGRNDPPNPPLSSVLLQYTVPRLLTYKHSLIRIFQNPSAPTRVPPPHE